MNNNEIYTGTEIKIYATLTNESGVGVSTTGLRFYMFEPGGIGYTFTFGVGTGLGNTQNIQGTGTTGVYYKSWTPSRVGKHKYTWEAYNGVNSAFKSFFEVKDSRW
jgi:hypothetical protein